MPRSTPRFTFRRNLVLLTVALTILVGVIMVAMAREATQRALVVAAVSPPTAPSRPPLTRAEEAYIQALWPIHGAVERSATWMSLGQIFYVIKDLKKSELKTRATSSGTYRGPGQHTRALRRSLQRAHDYTRVHPAFQSRRPRCRRSFTTAARTTCALPIRWRKQPRTRSGKSAVGSGPTSFHRTDGKEGSAGSPIGLGVPCFSLRAVGRYGDEIKSPAYRSYSGVSRARPPRTVVPVDANRVNTTSTRTEVAGRAAADAAEGSRDHETAITLRAPRRRHVFRVIVRGSGS